MTQMDKLRKFRKYLEEKNIFYALRKAAGYFVFLIKKQALRFNRNPLDSVSCGKLRVICAKQGVNIFYAGKPITSGSGLNEGIKIAGSWLNSTSASWKVMDHGVDYLKIRVVFSKIGLSQIWSVKIENESRISWQVASLSKQQRRIEETRMVCLVNPVYKNWIVDYQQGDFPRLGDNWREFFFGRKKARLAGVRFSVNDYNTPSFMIIPDALDGLLPVVQNPPADNRANIIGFTLPGFKTGNNDAGYRDVFSASIELFVNEDILDERIEKLRQADMASSNGKETVSVKKKRN